MTRASKLFYRKTAYIYIKELHTKSMYTIHYVWYYSRLSLAMTEFRK